MPYAHTKPGGWGSTGSATSPITARSHHARYPYLNPSHSSEGPINWSRSPLTLHLPLSVPTSTTSSSTCSPNYHGTAEMDRVHTELPLPPPPPPPPRPSNHTHLGSKSWKHVDFDQLELQHEDLKDVREDLLGSRYRLQMNREEIRTVREKTGEKEGSAINQLRLMLHEQAIELPQGLASLLDDVHNLRDRLGSMEADYDEAEEKYNLQEMHYTQKESLFVDNLLSQQPSPSTIPGLVAADLTCYAYGSFNGSNGPASISQASPFNEPNKPAKFLRDRREGSRSFQAAQYAPVHSHRSFARSTRGYNDKAPICDRLAWSEIEARIKEWLDEMIELSPFQKVQLEMMDCKDSMDIFLWWDKPTNTQFLIEGSTCSSGHISQRLSAPDLFDVNTNVIPLDAPTTNSFLPAERVVDEQEDLEFPGSLHSDDLWDLGQKQKETPIEQHEQSSVEPALSVSSNGAATCRTCSSEDLASMTTIDRTSACLHCGSRLMPPSHPRCQRHVHAFMRSVSRPVKEWSIPTTPDFDIDNISTLSLPLRSSYFSDPAEQRGIRRGLCPAEFPTVKSPKAPTRAHEGEQHLDRSEKSHEVANMSLDPSQVTLPPSPELTGFGMPSTSQPSSETTRQSPKTASIKTLQSRSLDHSSFETLQLRPYTVMNGDKMVQRSDIDWYPFAVKTGLDPAFPLSHIHDMYNNPAAEQPYDI